MILVRYLSKHFVFTLLSLCISILILAGCAYFYMIFQLPDVATLKDTQLQIPLRIYTHDGQLIAEYGAWRRNPVSLSQVPKPLLEAVIATEDQRFFEHPGVDFLGIVRAARELVLTGQRNQGASTISMQVARNFFLTPEKTFSRKINEILLALKIDGTFSKEKILELYLNKIYLGQHAYGVSSAAEIYYGKSLSELSLAEMAMIAGLPQAPSKENPITNPAAARIRRDHVLDRMLEMKYIDKTAYDEAIRTPVNTYYHGPKITVEAPHVAEMARNVIYQQFGDDGYTQGYKVFTTVDGHLQQTANTSLRDGLIAYDRRHRGFRGSEKNLGPLPTDLSAWENALGNLPEADGFIPAAVLDVTTDKITAVLANDQKITIPAAGFSWAKRSKKGAVDLVKPGDVIRVLQNDNQWELTQIPKVQGALVSLDPGNGAMLALNGGFNSSDTGFNRVIQANRQPGSNFKPFIYAAALSKGYSLATIIDDAPISINDTGDPNDLWQPQNDDKKYRGPTRMHIGLIKSLNLVTIRVLQLAGVHYTVDYATRFGFSKENLPPYLSLALGTASVTPIQIASAYTVFANGGYRITPYFIEQIQNNNNKVLYQANPPSVPGYPATTPADPPAPMVIEPSIAYLMNYVLMDVIKNGTGTAAQSLNRNDIAGKTGTTNRKVDAWFSGFNRHVETTVWVGYDQPTRPVGEYGAQVALPIWVDYMKTALSGMPEEVMTPPPDVVAARIDPDTGALAYEGQQNAIFEMFRADTLPNAETPQNVAEVVNNDENDLTSDNPNVDNSSDAQLF